MNRKLTAITMSAMVASGIGAAALPATGAFAEAPSTAAEQSSRPSLAQAKKQLVDQTGTSRVSVVDGVGYSGDRIFFGAVVTGDGTVAFYANPGDGWGKSSERSIPETAGADDVQVRGANVVGAQYPVFVVDGGFTGNSTGQTIAFGHHDEKGWGVLVGKGDTLLPSGRGMTDLGAGLELDIRINDDGFLITHSLWGPDYDESNAQQTSDPIVRTWEGTGGDTLTMLSERGGPLD